MDFNFDATADAVAEVTASVLSRHTVDWADKFAEHGFDAPLHRALSDSGLLELSLPEMLGGEQLSAIDLLPLLQGLGASAAVVPAMFAGVVGYVATLFEPAQGDFDLTKLTNFSDGHWAIVPTILHQDAAGNISGRASSVLFAENANGFLVQTAQEVVAVARDHATVSAMASSSGWGECVVEFEHASTLVRAASQSLNSAEFLAHYRYALIGFSDGLISGATELGATQVTNREQFGKPLGTFQAVQQQIADIYVIARSARLLATAVGWRLSENLSAAEDLAMAEYWVAAEFPAALRTLTHLHGGLGVDLSYPLHRYYSLAKDLARLMGGVSRGLDAVSAQGISTMSVHTGVKG